MWRSGLYSANTIKVAFFGTIFDSAYSKTSFLVNKAVYLNLSTTTIFRLKRGYGKFRRNNSITWKHCWCIIGLQFNNWTWLKPVSCILKMCCSCVNQLVKLSTVSIAPFIVFIYALYVIDQTWLLGSNQQHQFAS